QIHSPDEGEVFARGEVVKEGEVLRHDADPPFDLPGLVRVAHLFTQNAHRAAGRREEAGQHFDRGRFPGAVRAKKAIKLAPFYLKIQTVHGAEVSEPPSQSAGFDGARHCRQKANGSSREKRLAFLPRVPVEGFAPIERTWGTPGLRPTNGRRQRTPCCNRRTKMPA